MLESRFVLYTINFLLVRGGALAPRRSPLRFAQSSGVQQVVVGGDVDRQRVTDRLRSKGSKSEHVVTLLAEPWLGALLADESRLLLFSHRNAAKEISEAYGAARGVQRILRRAGAPDSGAGALVFDVCSGRGFSALILSYLLPEARVVMLDADVKYADLAHVRTRPNLEFRLCNLFAERETAAIFRELSQDHAHVIASGVHLCGSLAPRLLSLATHLEEIDGLVVSPCCISGSLGAHAKDEAKATGKPLYSVLVETLVDIARYELAGQAATVDAMFDPGVLSPKNGFVEITKARGGAPCPPPAESLNPPPFLSGSSSSMGVQKMLRQYRSFDR